MLNKLLFVAGILSCVYVAIVILVYLLQSRLIYFPSRSIDVTPQQVNLSYEDVWLQTQDGDRIHGWYVPKNKARLTVLMLHGNGGNISHRLQTLTMLNTIGVNTLIIDYRGYGHSEGKPSEQATYLDAMAAWEYLTQKQTRPDSIVIFGRSLGGAIAVWLANEVRPRGLILESTFTSIVDMAQHHYPFLPVRYISTFSYDSMAIADNIPGPTFVLHSRADEIVPFDLGMKLYKALSGKKYFLEIQGGHNEGVYLSGNTYVNGLKKFFDSL